MADIFKVLAAALKAGSARADLLAHNLSNISTSGFKKILVAQRSAADGTPFLETTLDLTPGPELEAADPNCYRLKERGFFRVEGAGGELVMSSGRFSVDGKGRFCLNEKPVIWQGELKPVMQPGEPFTLNSDGMVVQAGREVGRIALADFQASQLRQAGGGAYRAEGKGAVLSGTVINAEEASNQDPLSGLVALMENYRLFELCQRAMLTEDRILEQSISEMGRSQ